MTEYHTLNNLMELSIQQQKEVWEVVQQAEIDESERTVEESYHKMLTTYTTEIFVLKVNAPVAMVPFSMNTMRLAKIYAVTSLEKSWKKL